MNEYHLVKLSGTKDMYRHGLSDSNANTPTIAGNSSDLSNFESGNPNA